MVATHYVSRVSLQRDKVETFDRYPFSLAAVRTLDHLDLHPKLTFFIGENGSGKSTLIEAIAVALASMPKAAPRTSASARARRSRRCMSTCASRVCASRATASFLRAESFFNVARRSSRSTR